MTECCYTLLNVQDSEPVNEMQIKQNLGEFWGFLDFCVPTRHFLFIFVVYRKGRKTSEDRHVEASNPVDVEW